MQTEYYFCSESASSHKRSILPQIGLQIDQKILKKFVWEGHSFIKCHEIRRNYCKKRIQY